MNHRDCLDRMAPAPRLNTSLSKRTDSLPEASLHRHPSHAAPRRGSAESSAQWRSARSGISRKMSKIRCSLIRPRDISRSSRLPKRASHPLVVRRPVSAGISISVSSPCRTARANTVSLFFREGMHVYFERNRIFLGKTICERFAPGFACPWGFRDDVMEAARPPFRSKRIPLPVLGFVTGSLPTVHADRQDERSPSEQVENRGAQSGHSV